RLPIPPLVILSIILVDNALPPSLGGTSVMAGGRAFSAGRTDSTPWPWSRPAVEPGLVVCPIPVVMPGMFPAEARELYRLAYERALAASRPSRYELALGASSN